MGSSVLQPLQISAAGSPQRAQRVVTAAAFSMILNGVCGCCRVVDDTSVKELLVSSTAGSALDEREQGSVSK